MDKTEKKTAEEMFLDIADQVVPDGTYLSSKDEVAVYRAMHEYAAQELADYKTRLKKRIRDWNSTSIEEVPPSYSWKDIFELIDQL